MDFYEDNLRRNNERIAELEAENRNLKAKYKRCRNDLCIFCGKYTEEHLGACNGCYYRE